MLANKPNYLSALFGPKWNLLCYGSFYLATSLSTDTAQVQRFWWKYTTLVMQSGRVLAIGKQICLGSLLGPKWNSYCALEVSFLRLPPQVDLLYCP